MTNKQLLSQGRKLILNFMSTIPVRSKRVFLCALECVWVEGIGLAWPVNNRRDFGKTLPQVGHRQTPRDSEIRAFLDAMDNESDNYTKLLVLMTINYGWRPCNQLSHARWRWVQYDEAGNPYAFVSKDGVDEGFKTNSRIIAYVSPVIAEALTIWKNYSPCTQSEDYIFPRRTKGHIDPNKPLDRRLIANLWKRFEQRHNLKHLQPVFFRHWVKTALRTLSDPALAAYQGHQPPKVTGERNTYDTPSIDAILAEQQAKFPGGAISILRPPLVVVEGLGAEMALVKQAKKGGISPMELAMRLADLWLKSKTITNWT